MTLIAVTTTRSPHHIAGHDDADAPTSTQTLYEKKCHMETVISWPSGLPADHHRGAMVALGRARDRDTFVAREDFNLPRFAVLARSKLEAPIDYQINIAPASVDNYDLTALAAITTAATLGICSSSSPGASCPSDCANGRIGFDQWNSV
jgi:hypothetical protein